MRIKAAGRFDDDDYRKFPSFKLAIKFHDNDFYYTFQSVLQILSESPWFDDRVSQTKQWWADRINELSTPCEHLFQARVDLVKLGYEDSTPSRGNYLKITAKDILLNEEVDEYLAETEWDNGETHVAISSSYDRQFFAV